MAKPNFYDDTVQVFVRPSQCIENQGLLQVQWNMFMLDIGHISKHLPLFWSPIFPLFKTIRYFPIYIQDLFVNVYGDEIIFFS